MTDLLTHQIVDILTPDFRPVAARRSTFVAPSGPESLQAEVERLRDTIAAAVAIFDDEQSHADEMVARGTRRGAATAVTQPRAARAMVKLLREATLS